MLVVKRRKRTHIHTHNTSTFYFTFGIYLNINIHSCKVENRKVTDNYSVISFFLDIT